MSRVLIIEDQPDLALGLQTNLELEGHDVRVAADGVLGLEAAQQWSPDLVILDLMLPGLDGFEVLNRLRRRDRSCRVLILTARGEELDKVRGLRSGADDYLTKPFSLLELLARVEALLRRSPLASSAEQQLRHGELEIDIRARRALLGGRTLDLTPKEFDLLVELARHPGEVIPRLELLRRVWGHAAVAVSRTVDTHVAELRRKLDDDIRSPRYIATVHKRGYRFGG